MRVPPSEQAANAVTPTMIIMLKMALPAMVPKPSLPPVMRTVTKDVKSSGADEPAAIKVAPATSSESPSAADIFSRLSQK